MLSTRHWIAAALFAVSCGAFAQNYTLQDAIADAQKSNGTIKASLVRVQVARANSKVTYAQFMPTVEGSASQENGQVKTYTGPFKGTQNIDTLTAVIDANWRLLDNGQREIAYRQSQRNIEAAEIAAESTVRNVLFNVKFNFLEALRRQELLAVEESSLNRAKEIYEQTKFRADDAIGDVPKKDVLQAEADYLNAKVSMLAARNRASTAIANLEAVVGRTDLPKLQKPDLRSAFYDEPKTLEDAYAAFEERRPEIKASKNDLEAQKLRIRSAQLDGSVQYAADVRYRHTFAETAGDNASLVLSASYFLFDGGRSKNAVKAQELTLSALQAELEQQRLDIRSEVQGNFNERKTNSDRLEAAELAKKAAALNYKAAIESQKEGAANLIEVLTAQVTFATADSNLVEAEYDEYISRLRLALSLGYEMEGEKEILGGK